MDIKLRPDDNFMNGEFRNDYYVSGKQKKVWACELDLSKKLLEVCQKYSLTVSAYAGTILGAARHGGFIPWDDDMDFCMPREDFDKFINVASKEFTAPYFLQTAISDPRYFIGFARLRNSSTTAVIIGEVDENYNNGIYIDIFVMDGYIENRFKYKKQLIEKHFWTRLLNITHPHYVEDDWIHRMIKKQLRRFINRLFDYQYLCKKYHRVLSRYNDQTNRISMMTHPKAFIEKYYCYMQDMNNVGVSQHVGRYTT